MLVGEATEETTSSATVGVGDMSVEEFCNASLFLISTNVKDPYIELGSSTMSISLCIGI